VVINCILLYFAIIKIKKNLSKIRQCFHFETKHFSTVSEYRYTCSKNDVILSVRKHNCALGLELGLELVLELELGLG